MSIRIGTILFLKLIQNQSKIDQKSSQNRSLRGSWGLLGGSWGSLGGVLGPSWLQHREKASKDGSLDLLGPPKTRPKSFKNRSGADQKCDIFLDGLLDRFFLHFGANLASIWDPKPIQNGAKLAQKSIKLGSLIWELLYCRSWLKISRFFNII